MVGDGRELVVVDFVVVDGDSVCVLGFDGVVVVVVLVESELPEFSRSDSGDAAAIGATTIPDTTRLAAAATVKRLMFTKGSFPDRI